MLKTENEKYFSTGTILIVLISLLLFLAPRYQGNLRYEDFLTPIIFIYVLITARMYHLNYIYPSIFFIAYIWICTIYSILYEYVPIEALIILGKETQYFFIFFLTIIVLLKSKKSISAVLNVFKLIILFTCLYILYAVFFDVRGYYGISSFNEYGATLTALLFFNLFVINTIIQTNEDKISFLSLLQSLILLVGLSLVGSREGFLSILIFIFLYFFLFKISYVKLYSVFFIALIFPLIALNSEVILNFLYHNNISNIAISTSISRLASLFTFFDTLADSRITFWERNWEVYLDTNLFFGNGRGASHSIIDGKLALGLGGDNQYIINLIEIGIIGSLIFLFIVLYPSKYIKSKWALIWYAYLFTYILWGLSAEIWLLSKGGTLFWMVTALLISLSSINQVIDKKEIKKFRE